MLKPVNSHLLIEPVKHDSFMAMDKGTYEEIGVVTDVPDDFTQKAAPSTAPQFKFPVKIGDKVYFDSFLAAKYPKNETEWYWVVKWEDIRMVDSV